MKTHNKYRGRAQELDAMRYFEYWGYDISDAASNEAYQDTNADFLIWEDWPKNNLDNAVEVQVKYTKGGSFGLKKLYNTHEKLGGDLGVYLSTEPSTSDTKEKLDNRRGSDKHIVYWQDSGIVTAPADVLAQDMELPYSRYVTDYKMPESPQEEVEAFDIYLCRISGKPWMMASKPEFMVKFSDGRFGPDFVNDMDHMRFA